MSPEPQNLQLIKAAGHVTEISQEGSPPELAKVLSNTLTCPTSKITLYVDIPTLKVNKGIRLLPSQSLNNLLKKLQRKKIIGVLYDEIIIMHVPKYSPVDSKRLPSIEYERTLWELGIRDQDWLTILIDPSDSNSRLIGGGKEKPNPTFYLSPSLSSESINLLSHDDPPRTNDKEDKKKESLLNRFRSAAVKTLRGSSSTGVNNAGPSSATLQQSMNAFAKGVKTVTLESSMGLLFGVHLDITSSMGAPLMSCEHYGVPTFIESAFTYLYESERTTEGIFRISGSSATIKNFKKIIDEGKSISWKPGTDAHNATGLIKLYLRELPDPLITLPLFEAFYRSSQVKNNPEKLWELMGTLLCGLPKANYGLLKFIIMQVSKLSGFEEYTKMGMTNLATLIGPNLSHPPEILQDQQGMFLWTSQATAIALCLIQNNKILFKESPQSHYLVMARVIFNYEAGEDDELDILTGEIIFVSNTDDAKGWWEGEKVESDGRIEFGRFPSNYVQVLHRKDGNFYDDLQILRQDENDNDDTGTGVDNNDNDTGTGTGTDNDNDNDNHTDTGNDNDNDTGNDNLIGLIPKDIEIPTIENGMTRMALADETTPSNNDESILSSPIQRSLSPIPLLVEIEKVKGKSSPVYYHSKTFEERISLLEVELVNIKAELREERRKVEQLTELILNL